MANLGVLLVSPEGLRARLRGLKARHRGNRAIKGVLRASQGGYDAAQGPEGWPEGRTGIFPHYEGFCFYLDNTVLKM